jgi:cell wall-associated NlpC family hydrolase
VIELLIAYALSFTGTPYKWGGNNPMTGFDCSGFVGECLKAFNVLNPACDYSSRGIFKELVNQPKHMAGVKRGAILFFGNDLENISHTAIALSEKVMLEAGGGDATTISKMAAEVQNAFVRVRPIRRDLVASIILGED